MSHHKLKAINPEKGILRWYELQTTQDLWGHGSVILSYGRIGSKGRTKIISFTEEEEMERYIHKALRKRLTSEKRIGCNYTLTV